MTQDDIITRYRNDDIDFKECVCQLVNLGTIRPRDAYRLARAEEEAKMQRIARKAWAIEATDRQVWSE